MSGKIRASLLSLTIIVVIIFSAFGPATIVYADGETPEAPPAEATAVQDEAPAEDASTEATGESTEASSEEATAESTEEETAEVEAEPVLTEVPENTTVTVLDANGDAQPLATQEAANAIAESDPIWCPAGASPTPGANGCTGSFNSFDALLTFLSGNAAYQGAGTIYVEQGAYTGNDPDGVIDFNSPSYDLSNIRNANLTVTGGWDPGSGTTTSTSNFNNTRILIGSSATPWGGSVAVNNITMTFSQNDTAPATPENGLTIYSQGDVDLTNVNISVAPSAGVEIDAGGGVTIRNSKFHRNKTAGAIVRATGEVIVEDSEFQNPRVNRQRRQIVGLDVHSGSFVTLVNVLANGNREVGVNIVAGESVVVSNGSFSGMMEFVGPTNAPTDFLGYGLQVETPGDITLANIVANNNFLWGARLDAGGRIAIVNSIFNANTTESPGFIDDTGLFITNAAVVAISNVQANDNRLFGAQINSAGNVSINGSTFNNNRGVITTGGVNIFHGHGLQITSGGDILINDTDAIGNSLFGAQLNAAGQVSISASPGQTSDFSNTGTGPNGDVVGQSLEIVSGGDSSLANVVLNNNQANGATIQANGTAWLENVTANDNGGDGVSVQASCVHLLGGNYSGNGQYGLNLNGSALNLLAAPAFSGNGAGDIFPDNPPTCTFFTATGGGAANIFTSQSTATAANSETTGSQNVSLTEFLASGKTSHGSIFFGRYAYADTAAGIQVFALVPSVDVLAMD